MGGRGPVAVFKVGGSVKKEASAMLLSRLCFILVVVAASAGQAEIVTFGMEGTVNSIDDPLGFIDFAHPGDRVVYEFSIDLATPDSNSTPTFAEYYGATSVLNVEEQVIGFGTPLIQISYSQSFRVTTQAISYAGLPGSVYFVLSDNQNMGIPDHSLLSLPYPNLGLFEYREFQVSFFAPAEPPGPYPVHLRIVGPIDKFYVVPEPGMATLVTWVLLVFAPRRRRQPGTER